jgi:PHD/YefM family antitoxin component YafN of YafNO toxin-antitoxin module
MMTANELKKRGASALEAALQKEGEVVVTVRGRAKYVALPIARYQELMDAELELAIREAEADYRAGRVTRESAKAHFERLGL